MDYSWKRFTLLILLILSEKTFAKEFISITAVGDIMMGTTYPSDWLPENDGANLFKAATPWIKSADIRFGNFEGTFFDGDPQPDGKTPGPNRWLFRTPPKMVSVLNDAGFNVVSLANNHVRDFGQAGANSTKETLKNANIQYSSKSGEMAMFNIDGTEVALIAADFYKAPRSITEPATTLAEIKRLKDKNILVIVSAHVGAEGPGAEIIKTGVEVFLGENRGDSIAFAHSAIDFGADVILMHGPHVPRGMKLYKNRLIAYSLGNFLTGQGISLSGLSKIAPLLRIEIDNSGRFRTGQIISFIQKQNPHRLELDSQKTALRLINKLSVEQFPDSSLIIEENGQLK